MGRISLPDLHISLPFLMRQKLSVGIDIGSHSIKACQLEPASDGYRLAGLGSAILPSGAVEDGVLQEPEIVAETLKKLVTNLKIKGRKVAISVSGYSVIVKKINLAVMGDEELASHIEAEAEQYIPFDIDDVYLDYADLKTNAEDEDRTDVMLVAAKRDMVEGYLDMLKAVGLRPVVVDVDAFALENAYGANFGGGKEIVALVDIGASKMNINIVSRGTSILVRDVVLGSRLITEQIQSHFDITFEEAEAIKIGLQDAGERKKDIEDICVTVCTQWVTEVKRALDFYYSNYPDEKIDKMVLSGGGAKVKGVAQLFSEETGLRTEIFNPFARAEANPARIDPDYMKFMGPEMALAAGLATREVAF